MSRRGHCTACDPTGIVAETVVIHHDGRDLCRECAEDAPGLAHPTRCHSCGRLKPIVRVIGDLWQCYECVVDEARERSEQRQ